MGSPNTPKVSFSLLGEWNLETSQCGGLLGFPGWANVGVPATPASWSHHPNHYPRAVLVVVEKKHSVWMQHCTETLRMLTVSFYHLKLGVKIGFRLKAFIATSGNIHLHPTFPPPFASQFPQIKLHPFHTFFFKWGIWSHVFISQLLTSLVSYYWWAFLLHFHYFLWFQSCRKTWVIWRWCVWEWWPIPFQWHFLA